MLSDWFASKHVLAQNVADHVVLDWSEGKNLTDEQFNEYHEGATMFLEEEISKSDLIWTLDGYRQLGRH